MKLTCKRVFPFLTANNQEIQMKRMNRVLHTSLAIAVLAVLVGCNARVTKESFDQVGRIGCKTEAEVLKKFGPGVEVKDSYTESIIVDDKLPATARFVRYQDAENPAALHHVVYVDGRVVESDTWIPGKTAADRDKGVEIARKEYEKSHATNSIAPASATK